MTNATQPQIIAVISAALPEGVSVQAATTDAIAVGEPRGDGLAPLAVIDYGRAGYQIICPDPVGAQTNSTDIVIHVRDTNDLPEAVVHAWTELREQADQSQIAEHTVHPLEN